MVQGIEIPKANPISLRAVNEFEGYSDEYYQSCYLQKFFPEDKTAIQLLSAIPLRLESAYLSDKNGLKVGEVEVSFPVSSVAGAYITELRPDFSAVKGICFIRCELFYNSIRYPLQSRPLQIGHFKRSCFISYSSAENDHGVLFFTGITFGLRVEGGFVPKALKLVSDDTIFKDEQADFELLKSTPYDIFTFTAGGTKGIPDWLASIINRAFSCTILAISNTQVSKVEEASWEPNDISGYDLRAWTIDLSKPDASYSPTYDKNSAYWLNYRCQLQNTPIDYAFTFTEGGDTLTKTINESGQSIAVGLISERSGLVFDSVSIEDVPAWLTVSKSGLTYTFTAGENTAGDREAAVVFRQGESGKTITLNLSQASNIKDIEIHADYDNFGKRFALDALGVPVASNLLCTLGVTIQLADGTIDTITITGMLDDGIAHSDYDYTAIGIPNDAIVLEVKTFTISPDSDSRYVYLPVKPKPTLFVRINTRTATIDPYNMQSQAFLENPQTGERVNAEQIITAKITITADNVTGFPISELTRELTLPIPSGSSQSAVRKPSFGTNEKGAYSGAKNATMVTLESSGYKYYAYSEALLKDDRYFIQLGRATYLPPDPKWSYLEVTALSERAIDVNTSSGTPLSALDISCNAYCLYLDANRQNIEEYVNLSGGGFNLSIPYGQTQSTEQSDSLDIDTSRVYEILLVGAEYSASGYTGSSEVAVLSNQHLLRSVGQAVEMDGKKVQLQYFLFSLPFAKLQTNIRISQTASVTFTSGGVQQVLTFTHDFYLTYMEANLGDKRTDSVVLPDSLPVSDDDTYTVEVVTTIEASKPERFYLDNIILIN